jgi:hypothetical protein
LALDLFGGNGWDFFSTRSHHKLLHETSTIKRYPMQVTRETSQIIAYIDAIDAINKARSEHLKDALRCFKEHSSVTEKANEKICAILYALWSKTQPAERLHLHELRSINNFSLLHDFLLEESLNQGRTHSRLAHAFHVLGQETTQVKVFESGMHMGLQYIMSKTLQSGDLVFRNKERYAKYAQQETGTFKDFTKQIFSGNLFRMQNLVAGPITHAAILNRASLDKDYPEAFRVAELLTAYQNKMPYFETFIYSDFYRLDFNKLFTTEGRQLVETLRNLDFNVQSAETFVRERFQKIVDRALKDNHKALQRTENSQLHAACAYIPSLCSSRATIAWKKSELQITKATMHCSEFVARVSLYCLISLEETLKAIYIRNFPGNQIEIKKASYRLLCLPISEKQKLEKLHPGKLFSYLQPYLQKINTVNIVQTFLTLAL